MDKVEALREELRNGRRASKAGAGVERHREGANRPAGSGIQDAGRDNGAPGRNGAAAPNDQRSSESKSKRKRQGGGRPGNDGGSAADGSKQAADARATSASIEAVDPVLPPTRDNVIPIDKKPAKERKPLFPKGLLSAAEAKEYQEPLAAALIDYGGYVDRYLRTRAGADMPDIWGDLTQLEADVLARVMIRRGQRNAVAASVVRNVVESSDYVQAIIIVVPRVIKTSEMLVPPRKRRVGNENSHRPANI